MDLFGQSACACISCRPEKPEFTYSERHRHECEVRDVIGLPTNADRTRYLDLVQKKRGANAAERLRSDCWKAMKLL